MAFVAMPTEPVGFPQMGSGMQGGLQLVRDPSGHVILIHAAGNVTYFVNVDSQVSTIRGRLNSFAFLLSTEQMQQAVVWPNYSNHNNNVAPPPLLLPPPPPSIQLLSDIGGARLVLTESKRKQQSALPIVKIEAECSNSPTTIISEQAFYLRIYFFDREGNKIFGLGKRIVTVDINYRKKYLGDIFRNVIKNFLEKLDV